MVDLPIQLEKAVLDGISFELMVIDPRSLAIIFANKTFLAKHGLKDENVIGKKCYEVTHQRDTICSSADDPCPLKETLINKNLSRFFIIITIITGVDTPRKL